MQPDLSSFRLSTLPTVIKVVLTFFLFIIGIGYLVSLFNLYLTYHLTDGQPGLTVEDLKRAFYGQRGTTRLAAKIDGGSMEQFLPSPGDKEKILSWIQDGASEAEYLKIHHIFADNCIRCHHVGGFMSVTPLTSYQEVMQVVKIDRGEPAALWARVAHTHILSLGISFLCLGLIFSFSGLSNGLKLGVVTLPFVVLIVDFGSRFLTRYFQGFIYIMALTGALLGLSFAIMILVPLYELWIGRSD